MKQLSLIILILFCLKGYSQGRSSFSTQIKNETLKLQIINQERISREILTLFDADKDAETYIDTMTKINAQKFRKEQNLRDDQNILTDSYVLSHEDSVKLKMNDRDALLYQKFVEYSQFYRYIDKLSPADKLLRNQFYTENLKLIDTRYKEYFQNNRKHQTKYEKLHLQSVYSKIPELIKCEGNPDIKKCFSTIFRSEIEKKYEVEEYINYNIGLARTKVLFRITKNGIYEPLEISQSSDSYFLDMNAIQIAKSLFGNQKIAKPNDEDFYTVIPLTFSFD